MVQYKLVVVGLVLDKPELVEQLALVPGRQVLAVGKLVQVPVVDKPMLVADKLELVADKLALVARSRKLVAGTWWLVVNNYSLVVDKPLELVSHNLMVLGHRRLELVVEASNSMLVDHNFRWVVAGHTLQVSRIRQASVVADFHTKLNWVARVRRMAIPPQRSQNRRHPPHHQAFYVCVDFELSSRLVLYNKWTYKHK